MKKKNLFLVLACLGFALLCWKMSDIVMEILQSDEAFKNPKSITVIAVYFGTPGLVLGSVCIFIFSNHFLKKMMRKNEVTFPTDLHL